MHSIGAMKAPGPDGITGLFFHTYWDTVKSDVIEAVQKFFPLGTFLNPSTTLTWPLYPNVTTLLWPHTLDL